MFWNNSKRNNAPHFLSASVLLVLWGNTVCSNTDDALYYALRQAVSLKSHSAWPNLDQGSLIALPTSKILELLKTWRTHWRKIPDAVAGAALRAEEQCDIRKQYRTIIMWLLAHQPGLNHLIDSMKKHLAYRLGLLSHYQQWPVELNRGLRSQPLHRCIGHAGCPKQYRKTSWKVLEDAIARLEQHLPMISEDCRELLAAGVAYEEGEGLQLAGSWRAIDVVKLIDLHEGPPPNSHVCQVQSAAPRTCAAIAEFVSGLKKNEYPDAQQSMVSNESKVWLHEAQFHLMLPGTHVMAHTAIHNQRLKIHCGLRNPGKVELQIANHSIAWKEGRCIVIDDSYEHSVTLKQHQQARAILQLKISHPDLSTAPLLKMGRVVSQPPTSKTQTEL